MVKRKKDSMMSRCYKRESKSKSLRLDNIFMTTNYNKQKNNKIC